MSDFSYVNLLTQSDMLQATDCCISSLLSLHTNKRNKMQIVSFAYQLSAKSVEGVQATWRSSHMVLCALSFITNQCNLLEFPKNL